MNTTARDFQPEPVDIENQSALLVYLCQHNLIKKGERPSTEVLRGGVSNRTVLVEPAGCQPFVLKQALAKLRVTVDWYSDPSRIHREALGLRYLPQIAPPNTITPLLFEDIEQHIIGMTAVPRGHRSWKEMLLSEGPVRQHVLQFAEILASIHKHSSHARELLEPVFQDQSVFESLRLEPYYLYSSTQVQESQEFLFQLLSDTRRTRISLVHGDYSPKNILVHNGRLILIDHEVVHFGDPAFDLGFSLTHLLSKANHCREHRAAFLESAKLYIERYSECAQTDCFDVDFESRACRHTLGCLLARVVGRSPLEYLDKFQRATQQRTVMHLMERPPIRLADLVHRFGKELCVSN